MKKDISQKINIPEGINCEYLSPFLKCKKDTMEVSRKINIPQISIKIKNNKINFECKKGNKTQYKKIMTCLAHIRNIFKGLDEKFVYKLESVSVHFPMTLKVQDNLLTITNYLGEKVPRTAKILPNVDVDIKDKIITIASLDKEAAGQTAANFEKASKLKGKDRRIFQDGIFITEKPKHTPNKIHKSLKGTEEDNNLSKEQDKSGDKEK